MKIKIMALALTMAAASAFAGDDAHQKLVAEYIKLSRMEQTINAETQESIKLYSANAGPDQKAMIEHYVNAAVGWGALKDEYAKLVGETYTSDELRAAVAFLKTPAGSKISDKSPELARRLTAAMSKNMQSLGHQMAQAAFEADESGAAADGDLIISNVEEHQVDGRTYFTGMLENSGKKAKRGVEVEVNLFKGERFVDQYSTYISGVVPAGAQRYFKISCGCKDNPPAPHDSYKVSVVK